MKSLLLAALFLAPEPPPVLDAYGCDMKGRPGDEKFRLLIRTDADEAWISDRFGLEHRTVKRTADAIVFGERNTPAPDGGGFEIVYVLDSKTSAIRLMVLVDGKIDSLIDGRCEQFKHVAPLPGLRQQIPIAPPPMSQPRN